MITKLIKYWLFDERARDDTELKSIERREPGKLSDTAQGRESRVSNGLGLVRAYTRDDTASPS